MRHCFLLCAVVVVAFLAGPFPAHATSLESASRVTAATIFADRAIVTRTATVHIPAGAHTITITDIPAGIDASTLRVQGKSAVAVKIGTVEMKTIYLTDAVGAAEREKNAAIEAKTDEKSFLEGEIKALQKREDFINQIVAQGATQTGPSGTKLDFTPEKWAQAWNLVQTGMAETEKAIVTKNIALRKLGDDLARLQEELNQVRSVAAKERHEIRVNYESAAEGDLELSLTYQTGGATWRPVYDARLDTTTGALTLEQYGQVAQQTGEDWSDVDLTLSTARPAQGSEMPRLGEWIVRLYQPVAMHRAMASFGNDLDASSVQQKAMPAAMDAPAPALAAGAPKDEEAVIETASAQTTEYAAEFHVPGPVDLKSVSEPSKLLVGKVNLKAELASQISPRLATQAYLFAKATNTASYPLIPGLVAKYRDGAFIGNAALPMLRPDETANLSFGIDDRVKVTYQRIKDEQSNPALVIVGDMTTERHYQTKVQNLHKTPTVITVFEQYPVSGDADVSVTLLDDVTTPNYAKDKDNRRGTITWSATYAPKEEKTFVIGFRVKYPRNHQVAGL